MKMDCVTVSSDVVYKDKECYNRLKSDYSLDMWEEMKKRWLMFGVLFSIMLAVLAPRVGASGGNYHACLQLDHSRKHCTLFGHDLFLTSKIVNDDESVDSVEDTEKISACVKYFRQYNCHTAASWRTVRRSVELSPWLMITRSGHPRYLAHSQRQSVGPVFDLCAGPLHTEYASFVPLSFIYYAAGCRTRLSRGELRAHARLCALSAAHAHVAAPALCVVTVAAFEDIVDHRIVKGALLSSVGGPCGWLSLSLSQSPGAAPAVATSYLLSLVAAPLGMLVLCGRATIPPLGGVACTVLTAGPPFLAGALRPRSVPIAHPQLAALLLLYADCCTRLAEAEGSLYIGDVLITLLLELCCAWWSLALCWAYARCGAAAARDARSLALCALPKALAHGWESSVSCSVTGLSLLPGVLRAPAHALLLAALADREETDPHARE